MWETELPALRPIQFFNLSYKCRVVGAKETELSSLHLLPQTELLTQEQSFASCKMGWQQKGLRFSFQIDHPLSHSFYPQLGRGDAIELFLDTRDLKTTGVTTRFCHHFFFLPSEVDGRLKGEISRFRGEDSHPLCSPDQLISEIRVNSKGYLMHLFIPAEALFGYDPSQFNRMGFTYRVSRFGAPPQHFAAVSPDFSIDQFPSLWASLLLDPTL